MQNPLDELYDQYNCFVPDTEIQKKIEACHQQLIRSLEKPERKLILQIIDGKDMISEFRAKESFACGFWLAWRLLSHSFIIIKATVRLRSPSRRAVVLLCGGDVVDEA